MFFYEISWNILRNGGLNKKLNIIQWNWVCSVDLFCLQIIFTTKFEHRRSHFHVSSLFNTNKIMQFFPFCLSLVFHNRSIPCKVQQQSASTAQFHFPWYLFSIEETSFLKLSPCSSFTVPHFSGKNSNVIEGSVCLVTCCSLISGSSAKYCLQTPHSFKAFWFPKILLLQI